MVRRRVGQSMLIASMAVISARHATLPKVVESLLAQTLAPQKILIYYSTEPWHLDAGWDKPPVLPPHPAIELVSVPNIGSCRKYLLTLDASRNTDDTLVLVDDDRIWHPAVFERLVTHVQGNSVAATTRGWSNWGTSVDENGVTIFHTAPIFGTQIGQPTPVLVANSGWATCFRTADVEPALFSKDLHDEYQIWYSDEIFLSAMLKPDIRVVPMPSGYFTDVPSPVDQWRSSATSAAKMKQLRLLHIEAVPP